MADLPVEEAQALVNALVQLAQMADRALPAQRSPLATRLQDHLGVAADGVPNTSTSLPVMERVNVQLALDALADDVTTWDVIGLSGDVGNYHGVSLPGLLAGTWRGPTESARQYVSEPVGVDATIACLRAGIVLTEHDGIPVALMLYVTERHMPEIVLEVVAADQPTADAFLRRLQHLMDVHNAFRGQVISFTFDGYGQFGTTFVAVPAVRRDDVILRAGELQAIEEHTIGIAAYADELRTAGQHVKRGLLLYGPPGTGKTHTIGYLLGQMEGRTTIILSGGALQLVGRAGALARHLQPATIVIEDVDLIGMDRSLPGGEHNLLLFQLLNEMDGLAADADVLFILTTNRVEMLEPALAARPGRVDQAVELSLPDAPARRRLVELYTGAPLDDGDEVVARLAGVAPAFIKELARRAALVQLRAGSAVDDAVRTALDEMLEHATPVLRSTLAGPDLGAYR